MRYLQFSHTGNFIFSIEESFCFWFCLLLKYSPHLVFHLQSKREKIHWKYTLCESLRFNMKNNEVRQKALVKIWPDNTFYFNKTDSAPYHLCIPVFPLSQFQKTQSIMKMVNHWVYWQRREINTNYFWLKSLNTD